MAAFDLAAELRRHRLLAVADAENRHARLVDRSRRQRRVVIEHRGRPAREDHALRPHRPERLVRLLERHDLAIDLVLADPSGDELGHLRAEIDDQDGVAVGEPVGPGAADKGGIEDAHCKLCAPSAGPVKTARRRSPQPAPAGILAEQTQRDRLRPGPHFGGTNPTGENPMISDGRRGYFIGRERRVGALAVGGAAEIDSVTQAFQPWGRFSAANSP